MRSYHLNLMFAWTALFSTYSIPLAGQATNPTDVDILLRGGLLHLGDGQPASVGDVAIAGDRIVAVGQVEAGAAGQEIDCRGLVVCPGFIDLHNHSDQQVLQKSTRAVINYLTQGCTTIVTGNCGSGPVDVGKYYDQIDQFGVGVNVVHLLPQGALRREVMGNEQRKALANELARMKELTALAMTDGAWGMSTGLIYVPSSYADTDELVELARIVGRYGGVYASHIRNENVELLSAIEEAMEIGRQADVPVHISHFKSSGKDSWGLVRVAAEMIEKARRANQTVTADQYPYTASSTSLDATLIPTWARSGGRLKMLARLDDPNHGPRMMDAISQKLRELDDGQRLQIAYHAPQPKWAGRRVAEIASEIGVDSIELVLRIIRDGGASIVNHSINEEDVRYVMARPWVATASDGRAYVPGYTVPHPRSYGTFSRKIGHYSIREEAISLEQAIRSASGLPADILRMQHRGYLRTGYYADVVVLDAERISDTATFAKPHNYSRGIEHVFVNGQPVLVNGSPTGALAGRALRSATHSRKQVLDNEVTTKLDRLFTSWDRPDSPGCALGVIKDGELIYRRGYGLANLDYGLPIKSDTVFYLASVSKQFVATCIALLALEGQISLDDDVRQFVPELPDYGSTITVRHLVHHTSGLRDYLSLMELTGKPLGDVHSDEHLLRLIGRQKKLNFPPGDRYLYCNTGYFLLGEIIRRVSGKTLAEYADQNIFQPLGMIKTRFHDDRARVVKNRAVSYSPSEDGFRLSFLANWDKVGSGGLLSTIDDLARWDQNFCDHKIGGRQLHDLLHTPGVLNDGSRLDYAFGMVIGKYKGLPTVSHGGSFMGFRTVFMRFPSERFGIVILSNLSDVQPTELAQRVADICLASRIRESLQRYEGSYYSDELEMTYEIKSDGLDLVLVRNGQSTPLKATGKPHEFSAHGLRLKFVIHADNGCHLLLNSERALEIRFDRQK